MTRIVATTSALLLAFSLANGQPAAPASGLVVGSGNYFSPIVRDLEAALAFYRDGLGLEVQGAPGDADANPALRDMFGLPGAKIRWAGASARMARVVADPRRRPQLPAQGRARLLVPATMGRRRTLPPLAPAFKLASSPA